MKIQIYSLFLFCFVINFSLKAENKNLSKNIYDNIIQPIFDAKCLECHGAEKNKGKLRLHTKEDFLKGGTGAGEDIVIKGDATASELIFRITLPKDDEEAMPPLEDEDHYNPITPQELAVMQAWIKMGASFDLLVSELDEATKTAAEHIFNNMPKKIISKAVALRPQLPEVPAAKTEILNQLKDLGILAMPIAQNTNALYVNASYLGKKFTDKELKLLEPLSEQLLWLNLARTSISDDSMETISKLKLLTRLHLENTSISDRSSSHLSKLSELTYLNLYGTNVSNSSVDSFKNLTKLKKIFLWKTKFTQDGVDLLKEHFANDSNYDELLKQKEKVQSSIKDITSIKNSKITELEKQLLNQNITTSDKKPINTKCPVANKPINNSSISIFEGRKIAFCCSKCKSKFDKDGAVYRSKIDNFKASQKYQDTYSNLVKQRTVLEKTIEESQEQLRVVTMKLNAIGPEINLGWN